MPSMGSVGDDDPWGVVFGQQNPVLGLKDHCVLIGLRHRNQKNLTSTRLTKPRIPSRSELEFFSSGSLVRRCHALLDSLQAVEPQTSVARPAHQGPARDFRR